MTTQPQLIPKPPRRMLQPRKDAIRRRAEIAEAMLAYQRTPIRWRIWHRIWARVIEVDKETAAQAALIDALSDALAVADYLTGQAAHPKP